MDVRRLESVAEVLSAALLLRMEHGRLEPLPVVVYSSAHERLSEVLEGDVARLLAHAMDDDAIRNLRVFYAASMVDRLFGTREEANGLDIDTERYFTWAIETRNIPEHHSVRELRDIDFLQDISLALRIVIHMRETACLAAGLLAIRQGRTYLYEIFADNEEMLRNVLSQSGDMIQRQFGLTNEERRASRRSILRRISNSGVQIRATEATRHTIVDIQRRGIFLDPALDLCAVGEDCETLTMILMIALSNYVREAYPCSDEVLDLLSGAGAVLATTTFLGHRALQTDLFVHILDAVHVLQEAIPGAPH
jgi:hypothetical protein